MKRLLKPLAACALLTLALSAQSQTPAPPTTQTPQFSTILNGAAYYNEYNPYERLDKDVGLMQQAGLTVVRMGEST